MTLDGVGRGSPKPPRIVLYGPPKIGKSTLGSETPHPIFVTTEDGVDNLPVDQFGLPASWEACLTNVKSVAEQDHEYQTLVVDTLNGAIDLAAEHVCQSQFKGNWGKGGFASYGEGWASTSEECRKLLPLLDQCRARDMIVLLLCHTGIQNVRNPIDGDYTKFTPALDKRVWSRLAGWADVILRAEFEHIVLDPEGKGKGKAIGDSKRILKASGSAAEDAGCRVGYELPDTLPLSWQELSAALGRDADTLGEVQARWDVLNDQEQAKAMEWLGVADLKEAPVAKLRQLLNRLKTKESDHAA